MTVYQGLVCAWYNVGPEVDLNLNEALVEFGVSVQDFHTGVFLANFHELFIFEEHFKRAGVVAESDDELGLSSVDFADLLLYLDDLKNSENALVRLDIISLHVCWLLHFDLRHHFNIKQTT